MNRTIFWSAGLFLILATQRADSGTPPTISYFSISPVQMLSGKTATLSWNVTGATSVSIDNGIGKVTGTSKTVTPKVTTTYKLTASNSYGSKTATISITVGTAPVISSFKSTPGGLANSGTASLSWSVQYATNLSLDQGIGSVTGKSSQSVSVSSTKTYTLTAGNSYGYTNATVTVWVGPPKIVSFGAIPRVIPKGSSSALAWTVWNSSSITINQGIKSVSDNSRITIRPNSATTYTMTATNPVGSVSSTATVEVIPFVKYSSSLFYTEHCLFIIPSPSKVTWTGSNTWASVYSTENIQSYIQTLKNTFSSDYFFVTIAANNLSPNKVPDVYLNRHIADGIGENNVKGTGVPNVCRYNIGGGTVIDGCFGVLDHEIGHNWGVFAGAGMGGPHWDSSSTATGQMACKYYPGNNYSSYYQISGDSIHGFTWSSVNNDQSNRFEVFSDQDLYLQGLNATFPDLFVLKTPVYNTNHTVSYNSVAKYDQAWITAHDGVRNPLYKTSEKRFRMGLVYIARDTNEIKTVMPYVERSINYFVNGESIDTATYRFEVPFLAETKYRGSVDALLADLDGNHTPKISVSPSYQTSSNGTAKVTITSSDADGAKPALSMVPSAVNCSISGSTINFTGLGAGSHFYTVRALDIGGKRSFAHFVIDVGSGLHKESISSAEPLNPSLCLNRAHERITYTIDNGGMTTLKFYSIDGRLISTPVEKSLEPGTYNYWLPRNRMASGVHIAVLQWSTGKLVLKMRQLYDN